MSDPERLLAEIDWLRALARSLVGAADADDLCQETIVAALQRRPATGAGLRPWLAGVARRLTARGHRSRLRRETRERQAARRGEIPSAAELAEQAATQRAVVDAVLALDEPYRETVLLRFWHGLSTRDIARHCRVPVETARTRLKRALAMLRARLDRTHGGRAAWVPVVAAFGGGVTMGMKTKVACVAAVTLAMLVLTATWDPDPGETFTAPATDPPTRTAAAAGEEQAGAPALPAIAREPAPVPGSPTPRPDTGTLRVQVLCGGDTRPAGSVGVHALAAAAPKRLAGGAFERTGADGTAVFPALPPGECHVFTDRGFLAFQKATVVPGDITELTIRLDGGLDVEGLVVDAAGTAVSGAEVHLQPIVQQGFDLFHVARTDREGRFRIPACNPMLQLSARAFGHAPSDTRLVQGAAGGRVEVRLQLGGPGGAVRGRVADAAGSPVPGAVVRIGTPPGVEVFAGTDREGRFHAIGVPAGEQPVVVRALDLAPHAGTAVVAAGATTRLEVFLLPGATLAGTVLRADGAPADGARVYTGGPDRITRFGARTAADGSYRLEGLPVGELRVTADLAGQGRVTAMIRTAPGSEARWDPRLALGARLAGRVEFGSGEPAPGVRIHASGLRDGQPWHRETGSGVDGRFAIPDCPAAGTLDLVISGQDVEQTRRRDIDPQAGELVLRVRRAAERSVTVRGTVLGPGREPLDATVWVTGGGFLRTDPATGRFGIGPLPPGPCELFVRAEEFPQFASGVRVVAAHETWDLGVIELTRGGHVRVALAGHAGERIDTAVREVSGQFVSWIRGKGEARTSEPLRPGRYHLTVTGPAVAAQVVPFEVRAGETTRLAPRIAAGRSCRIEIALPFADEVFRSVIFEVRRGSGELVTQYTLGARGSATQPKSLAFAPGEYEILARCGKRRGTSRFRVAGGEDPAPIAVRIE